MTLPLPPQGGKPWGFTKPGTKRWRVRYEHLRREGFDHNEAARLATTKIGTKAMLKGRRARLKWWKKAQSTKEFRKLTEKQIARIIMDFYAKGDWMDPWTQFYPEEEVDVYAEG